MSQIPRSESPEIPAPLSPAPAGARRPDRRRDLHVRGLRLAVWEWGDETAPPILFAHGGFDFAGTLDGFAPLLADAGWRVVCWDQRGHGDSEHAELYSWDADMRDMLAVLDSVTVDPVVAMGHSKGGAILTQLIQAVPHRFRCFVNIDGLPSTLPPKDVQDHERTRMLARDLAGWLDHRARAAEAIRKPGTIEELAKRRQRMNPRLSIEWLSYLVTIGARQDEDGWRWKIDPSLRMGGFGPWRQNWALERLASLPVPLLGIIATVSEEMGWHLTAETLLPWLPPGTQLEAPPDTGHFVHIERPHEIADLVLDFIR
ncbi:MAG: alpha/beta hydrolase [Myxococcales bacterium]|nr:alpha/beta hydrolase [Myxococcales bacterium]